MYISISWYAVSSAPRSLSKVFNEPFNIVNRRSSSTSTNGAVSLQLIAALLWLQDGRELATFPTFVASHFLEPKMFYNLIISHRNLSRFRRPRGQLNTWSLYVLRPRVFPNRMSPGSSGMPRPPSSSALPKCRSPCINHIFGRPCCVKLCSK